MKLSLRDLERLRENPRQFREVQLSFSTFSKTRALHLAVYKYHREHSDLARARIYFEEMYRSHFKQTADLNKWLNELVEYDAAYKAGNYDTFRVCFRTTMTVSGIKLTGEIPRLDIDRSGEREYAAWLLTRGSEAWRSELRMPLIQAHIAQTMHVGSDQVSVGVYDFRRNVHERECFTAGQIARARDELVWLVADIAEIN